MLSWPNNSASTRPARESAAALTSALPLIHIRRGYAASCHNLRLAVETAGEGWAAEVRDPRDGRTLYNARRCSLDAAKTAIAEFAIFAAAGAVLTFFGFIHGADGIGIGQSPAVAISYLAVAGILLYCAKYAAFHPVAMDMHEAAAEAD